MASSLIHSLSVLLKLDTSSFKKSVRGAEATLKSFGKGLLAAGGGIGAIAVFNKIGHAVENLNKERGGLKQAADAIVSLREAWKDLVSGALEKATPAILSASNVLKNLGRGLQAVGEFLSPVIAGFIKWAAISTGLLAMYAVIIKIASALKKVFVLAAAVQAAMDGPKKGGKGGAAASIILGVAGAVAAATAINAVMSSLDVEDKGIIPGIVETTKSQEQLTKQGRDLVSGLKLEVATFGMSARAADVYKAKLAGVSGEELAHARALNSSLNKMEAAAEKRKKEDDSVKELLVDLNGLSNEVKNFGKSQAEILSDAASGRGWEWMANQARDLGDELKELEKNASLDELGKSIAKDVMTPLESWTEKLSEMELLFQSGRIGAETYARALERIRTEATPEQGQVQFAGLASAQELGGISKVGSQGFGGSIANRQLTEQQQTNNLLRTIDLELKRIRIDGGGLN